MLTFLCYLSINEVRKHKCVIHLTSISSIRSNPKFFSKAWFDKCVIHFNFIIFDSIQSKVVFEGMVLIQNGFSFNLRLSRNGF